MAGRAFGASIIPAIAGACLLMATISMILAATLISEGTGLVFRGLFEGRAAGTACFDLFASIDDPNRNHSDYLDYIIESQTVYYLQLRPGPCSSV